MASFLRIVSQWPPKEAKLEIKKGMTIGDIKKAAAAALDLEEEYSWAAAEFGKDVIQWSTKKDTDLHELSHGALVYAIAPAGILPRRQLQNDSKEPDDVDEKFRGLTHDNIWKKLAKGKPPKVVMEYFDAYAEALMEHKIFVKLPKQVVVTLLKRDTIMASELKVFDAVVEWGKAELKRNKEKETPENLRKVLEGVITVVRVTTMSTEDVASKVVPSGVLEQQQTLDLFTYIAARDVGVTPAKSLSAFNHKEREGSDNFWNPADNADPRIELREKNLTVAGPSQYINMNMGVRAKHGYSAGRHFWTITIQIYNGGGNGYNTAGVCTKTCPLRADHGYPLAGNSSEAWVVELCRLQRIRGTSHGTESYGGGSYQLKNGDIVGFLLDMDVGTLQIYYNGSVIGTPHTGLKGKGPLYPVLGVGRLHQNIYVTNFKAKIPS